LAVDRFALASNWLAGKFLDHLSQPVTYSRSTTSITAQATVGKTQDDRSKTLTEAVDAVDRSYLILATELVALGEPSRYDTITQADGRVYIVTDWRWSDSEHKMFRIDTVRDSNP